MNIDEILSYVNTNKDNFNDLVENIDSVIPFVGAGMSAFLYPVWGEFLKNIVTSTDLIKEDDKKDLLNLISANSNEEVADRIEEEIGHNSFIKQVQQTYAEKKISDDLLNVAVNKLPQIFNQGIITTNFDRVLEKVYKDNQFLHIVYPGQNSLQIEGIQRDLHFLFKIHGDVLNRDSIILTQKQYEDNYGEKKIDYTKPLPKLLRTFFRNRVMLFLGCSLENDRTMNVLDKLTSDMEGLTHFTFLQKPSDFDKYKEMSMLLDKHSIYPIWYPDGKYECINILLDEIIKKSSKKKI
ncbi:MULTISPECIES: SIR2 family protein [unclassified Clostridium]|uniref:SIR2 family protein n=1 Tax=unclassified Clostridium TaxID=2614128 RepID=UPI00207AA57D|nr:MULTISPECIES: SIR2 family protein [unclassified Clostridium]